MTEKKHRAAGAVPPETVRRLNAGDIQAFNEIYRSCYVYLCSIALYYVHNRQTAASLVNDVFVAFWDRRRHITHPPLPYLRKAVQHACISHLRSSLYTGGHLLETDAAVWQWVENFILSSDDPLRSLEESDFNRMIEEQVDALPARCRKVFRACLYEGKTYREIAGEMGISESTVRVHIKNALERLRSVLDAPLWVLLLLLL